MPPKTSKVTAKQDADLLIAVIQVTGGVKGGVAFWKDVASAMNEEVNGEAARKRFDKFKPGASVKASASASANPEKDTDLLKAVIKANGGITGGALKGRAFWTAVADAMEEKINGEAARKRFDRFKPQGGDQGGRDGGGVAAGVKKTALAETKSTGKGRKTIKAEVNDGSKVPPKNGIIAKREDAVDLGQKENAAVSYATPKKMVHKGTLEAYVAEGKTSSPKKRIYVEAWAEDVSFAGAGDGIEKFEIESPARPTTNTNAKPAKKMKLENIAYKHEG